MSVLLQVSDAHFGTEDPQVLAALRALALEQAPDVAVWTGDLTQRAHPAQFAAARRFVETLPAVTTVAMPGNHDIPLYNVVQRAFRPYGNYRRAFGEDLEPVLDREDLLLLMVKTTRRWRHRHGELSATQIARVAQRLRHASPRQLRVVATHQPLHARESADLPHRVRATQEALAVWADAGMDLVLSGHTHRPDCYAVELGPRAVWVVKAGTSMSLRLRGGQPNSVNLIRHDAGSEPLHCEVQRWDYEPAERRFVRVARTRIALSR
ncbi:MAG TPA: metallophosphoesterase [Albitalea sp.]